MVPFPRNKIPRSGTKSRLATNKKQVRHEQADLLQIRFVEQQALVSLMRPLQVRPICKSLMDGHQAVSRTLADISRFIAELCGLPVVELGDRPEILDAPLSPESPPSPGKSVRETAAEMRELFDAQPMPDVIDVLTHLLADDLPKALGCSSSLPDSLPGPSRKPLLAHLSCATTDIDRDSDCATTLPDDSPEPSRRFLRARTTNSSHGSSSPIFRPRKAARL